MYKKFAFIALAIFFSGQLHAATVTVYTDRTSWENALAGTAITTETFSNPIAAADVILLDNGVVSTANPSDFGFNTVANDVYRAYTCSTAGCTSFAPTDIDWDLPASVNAIGGDFFSVNSGNGVSIAIDSLGYSGATIGSEIGSNSGFYGLISDMAFSGFSFRNFGPDGDAWTLDNFSSALGPLSPVPLPAAVWLFGSALLGLIGFGRRRPTS